MHAWRETDGIRLKVGTPTAGGGAPRAVQAQGRPGDQGRRLAPEIPYLCAERLIAFRTLIWALSVRSGV